MTLRSMKQYYGRNEFNAANGW